MVSCRRIQIDANSSPTKLNFELIKDPNIKPETLKLKDEKVENILELTGTKQEFLNRTPLAQALRSTVSKQDLMKLKGFYMAKDTNIQTEQQPKEWKKFLQVHSRQRAAI